MNRRALAGDLLRRSVEVRRGLVEKRGLRNHDRVWAVRRDHQPRVGQLPIDRHGVIDRDEDVAITVDEQHGQPNAAQLLERQQRMQS